MLSNRSAVSVPENRFVMHTQKRRWNAEVASGRRKHSQRQLGRGVNSDAIKRLPISHPEMGAVSG